MRVYSIDAAKATDIRKRVTEQVLRTPRSAATSDLLKRTIGLFPTSERQLLKDMATSDICPFEPQTHYMPP